ncbi:hypothetical protein GCM10023321_20260 [Pseudonocardia eucalypti]|uniref:Uncharacterized protein n=1 Tax=Pseudonocardia eucalypti TaxID=648755 RepID=A0ABP9Q0G6_9PSEU|nr:hypothetical protein [Pseudonocardia eucalypti]
MDESETRIVAAQLDDTELLITGRVPDLDAKITSGAVDAGVVVMVEADAVLRLIRNPNGYRTETDGNYSYEIDQRVASGRLMILDEEWALLGIRAAVFTIVPRMYVPGECFGGTAAWALTTQPYGPEQGEAAPCTITRQVIVRRPDRRVKVGPADNGDVRSVRSQPAGAFLADAMVQAVIGSGGRPLPVMVPVAIPVPRYVTWVRKISARRPSDSLILRS